MPLLLTAPTEEALEAVYNGSLLSMQHSMPTAQPLAQCYFEKGEQADLPLGNTFLNFFAIKPDLEYRPRSRSVGLCRLPTTAAEPAKVACPGHRNDETQGAMPGDAAECGSSTWNSNRQSSAEMGLELGRGPLRAGPKPQRQKRTSPPTPSHTEEGRKGKKIVQQNGSLTTCSLASAKASGASYTTIILQRLPAVLTQLELVLVLQKHGYENAFDFCYLPVDFATGNGRGYAFINFKSCEVASSFKREWHKSSVFCNGDHTKTVVADVAGLQGVHALLAQPSMKKLLRVKNLQYRPFIAQGGPTDH